MLVLRTLQDQHRSDGKQLFAAWVDLRKAYDTVPRQLLWQKLAARGLGGNWLRSVQTLYTSVPMSVRTADGLSPCFQATNGLKQGCPLSPTLFGLYIVETEVLEAEAGSGQLDLPHLGCGGTIPPLLYADDMALLATSAAGLQRQLDLLHTYCQRWGLTVNTGKTKVQLLSGAHNEASARDIAAAARLKYAGVLLTVVTCFKYLGINFHSTTCIAGAAAPARTQAARAALHDCRARCAALGVESAPSQLRLFSALVGSKLLYGAEVWGTQLAAKAAAAGGGSTRCAAEKLHLGYLRQLLGVRQRTPNCNAVVLAETGERPLWTRWLLRATRLWSRALAAPEDSLLRQAVMTNAALATAPDSRTPARQPWAQQLAAALIAAGMELDLSNPQPISWAAVRSCCAQRQLEQLLTAAANPAATKIRHYVVDVRGGTLDASSLSKPAAYLTAVRKRCQREALAQWCTGSHWGVEETGRWLGLSREHRVCPHCNGGTETVAHMIFACPLYAQLRVRVAYLFESCPTTLFDFMQQPAIRLARFASACRRAWLAVSDASPSAAPNLIPP